MAPQTGKPCQNANTAGKGDATRHLRLRSPRDSARARLRLAGRSAPASAAASARCGWPRRATASACSSPAAASPTTSCQEHLGPAPLLLRPAARLRGHLPPLDLQGRRDRQRRRRRRRQPRLRQHALPRPAALLRRPAVGRLRTTGAPSSAPHYDTAERMLGVADVVADDPADQLLREFGARDRRRRHLRQDARRRLLRRAGRDGRPTRTSAARGRRARAAPRAGAAWSAARSAPRTRWSRTTSGSPSAAASQILPERTVVDIRPLGDGRRRRRLRRCTPSAPAPGCARTAQRCTAARRRRRRRRARHQQAAAALPARGALPRALGRGSASSCAPTARRSSPSPCRDGAPRTSPSASRSPRASTPTPTPTSRPSPTASAGGSMSCLFTLLVGDGTRADAAAEAARRGAAPPAAARRGCCGRAAGRGARSSCSSMQTLDNSIALRPQAHRSSAACGCRPSRTRRSPTRPSSPSPTSSPSGSPSAPAASPRARSPRRWSTSPTTAHILGGAVIGESPRDRRRRRPPPRLRLREPARLRRRGGPGQRRRQPEPDDHRDGRARDEPACPRPQARRLARMTLPLAVLGSSAAKSTTRGYLYGRRLAP